MMIGLPVFKGKIVEPVPGKFSWWVSLEFQGIPGEDFFRGNDLFDSQVKAKSDMRSSMHSILNTVSTTMPQCFVDPSKFVDMTNGVRKPFTKQDLH